jgi:hypothetical protein
MDNEQIIGTFDEIYKTVYRQGLAIAELERRLAALEEESDFDAEIKNPMSSEAEDRLATHGRYN